MSHLAGPAADVSLADKPKYFRLAAGSVLCGLRFLTLIRPGLFIPGFAEINLNKKVYSSADIRIATLPGCGSRLAL